MISSFQVHNIPWRHEFLDCTLNRVPSLSIVAYAQGSQLTETVRVPGSQPIAYAVRALPPVLVILRHMYHSIWVMHRSGVCLWGQFGPANLLVYQTLAVRMTGPLHLSYYTRNGGDLDYAQLAASVEAMFTARESVPMDIQGWLGLIREGVRGYEYLIRYDVALMEPVQAFSWLMAARALLERLSVMNHTAFNMIVYDLHANLMDWNVDSYCLNTLLQATREHINPHTGLEVEFERNVRGLLTLFRNCSQHSARFMEAYMMLIVEEDFPGFVRRFQASLFRAGVIGHHHLEASMG